MTEPGRNGYVGRMRTVTASELVKGDRVRIASSLWVRVEEVFVSREVVIIEGVNLNGPNKDARIPRGFRASTTFEIDSR